MANSKENSPREPELTFDQIVKNYRRLSGLNPKHVMLDYICNVSDTGFSWNSDRFPEFLERFSNNGPTGLDIGRIFENYATALREVVISAMEKEISESQKLKRLPPDYQEPIDSK